MENVPATREDAIKAAYRAVRDAYSKIRAACREEGLVLHPTDLASATTGKKRVAWGETKSLIIDVEGFDPFEWGSHPGLYLFGLPEVGDEPQWTASVNFMPGIGWTATLSTFGFRGRCAPGVLEVLPLKESPLSEERAIETVRKIAALFKSA